MALAVRRVGRAYGDASAPVSGAAVKIAVDNLDRIFSMFFARALGTIT
jgi:hypothetical protein